MKKTILKISILTLTLIFGLTACNSNKNGDKNASGSSDVDVDDASAIIDYTSTLVSVINEEVEEVNEFNDNFTRHLESVARYKEDSRYRSFGIRTLDKPFGTDYTKFVEVVKEPVEELSQEDQEFFKKKFTEYHATFYKLMEQSKNLSLYLVNEDYKDDNLKKGDEIASKISMNLEQYYALHNELANRIDILSKKYEDIALSDHPYGDLIKIARSDLDTAEILVNKISNLTLESDITEIEKLYNKLKISTEKHEKQDIEVLKDYYKDHTYTYFYQTIKENFLPEVKKLIRDFKNREERYNTEYLNRSIKYVNSDYDMLINSYNHFAAE